MASNKRVSLAFCIGVDMPVDNPEQHELKVLTFYLTDIEHNLERLERKKNYVATYFIAAWFICYQWHVATWRSSHGTIKSSF